MPEGVFDKKKKPAPSPTSAASKFLSRATSAVAQVGTRRTPQAPSVWTWPTQSTSINQTVHEGHIALDIGGRRGSPVVSPTSGIIRAIPWQPAGYGLNVRLTTDTGEEIIFGHLDAVVSGLTVGQRIAQGQLLGLLGSTGRSTGPHLHFEVRPASQSQDQFTPGWSSGRGAVDPRSYFGDSPTYTPVDRPSGIALRYAPTTQPSLASRQEPYPGQSSGYIMATGYNPPAPTLAGSLKRISGGSAPAGGIVVARSTILGDVSVPEPGAVALKFGMMGVGAILILVSVFKLFGYEGRSKEVVGIAKATGKAAVRRATG